MPRNLMACPALSPPFQPRPPTRSPLLLQLPRAEVCPLLVGPAAEVGVVAVAEAHAAVAVERRVGGQLGQPGWRITSCAA